MKLSSPSQFTIRPIERTPENVLAILEVYRQCEDFLALGPVAQASLSMVQADLDLSIKEGCTFCGIYLPGGELAGIIDYSVGGFHGDPRVAFLSLLMIAAPNRGKGLGAAVVSAVEEDIRRAGQATTIDSGVQVNNPGGIRFWTRMGYRIVSEATDMGDGTTAYALRKDLES